MERLKRFLSRWLPVAVTPASHSENLGVAGMAGETKTLLDFPGLQQQRHFENSLGSWASHRHRP